MRDLVLLAALLGIIPLILRAPVVGLLAWIWITLMNPQREVFGFFRGFELNFYVAVLTALSWVASKERKAIPPNLLTIALVVFGAWTCLTTYAALYRPYSAIIWDRTIKSIILALAVATLANSRTRIQAVLWIFMAAIGYYAVKGGGFVLITGGRSHVYGPENTMIADNNALGLVLIVLLPLMNYLRVTSRLSITRLATLSTMGFTLVAIFGTYSRGALVALGAAAAAYAVRSRSGMLIVLAAAVLLSMLPNFLPADWLARMSTIQAYNQDESFTGRVAAWKTSYNIAAARPLIGGGFSAVDVTPIVQQFSSPGSLRSGKAAHSIYFEVLGDHGFVGLALYLLVIVAAWLNTFLVLNATHGRPELAWAGELARMLQVSLVAYLVGGAALSMAYYDGILVILALTASLVHVVHKPETDPAWETSRPSWRQMRPSNPLEPAV
ncbi:MAG: putative O-glycosylation ligase, exosortase A-associated [Phenylobacterium sp.]|nr:putative O-glycosylation ligase, exosortase A-associated [Phenylobacterium sp.]